MRSSRGGTSSGSVLGRIERELVAADAGRVVAEAQDPLEPLAERAERGVALLVALGVVDRLEVVEVDAARG